MQDVLANLVLSHAPLSALVNDRVDWDLTPQGEPKPRLVFFVVSGVVDYTMAGASGLVQTRVQADSYGKTAATARAVANALEAKLGGFRGEFQGVRFSGAFRQSQRTRGDKVDGNKWFLDSRDYLIWWAPA